MNSSKAINDKGADMMTGLVIKVKSDSFPKIPVDKNETNMGLWYDTILSLLSAAPWDMDGLSIATMERVDLSDATHHYRARSSKLSMILTDLMRDAKLTDTITSLQSTISTSDGMI